MAINLKSIQKGGDRTKPPMLLVYGTPGIGKTTFGAGAPSPIFIRTEDGLGTLQCDAFPKAETWSDVMDALTALYTETHQYGSVVVDSLSALETLIWRKVAADDGKSSVEELGYGRGYVMALDVWHQFLDGIVALRDKGMIPVLIAHSDVVRFDSPEHEPYDRYQIKLHKKAFQLHYERCDIIGFANYHVSVTKADAGFNKKVARGVEVGERRLHLIEKPAFIAKNRYSLPESIPFRWQALQDALSESYAATEAA
jgi:hypothetical protein